MATSSTAARAPLGKKEGETEKKEEDEKEGKRTSAKSSCEEIMERKLKEMMVMYENEKAEKEKAEKERDKEKAERYMVQRQLEEMMAMYENEKAEREKEKEGHLCSICIERARNMAFGCGHQVCKPCSDNPKLKYCHICRERIESRIQLF